ncbi:MAG: transposase [Bacteroidia bacterium]|nr:transposase [Bacteroidia bacterium]
MYYDFKVKIPEEVGKITRRTIKGVIYINYEYARIYKPDKKYNIPKRTTIGKLCDDEPEMMYPNANYLKFYPDAEFPKERDRSTRSSCLRIGSFLVVQKIIKEYGLDEMLARIIGRDSGLFLDLAAYSIISESNASQYYPDYAYNHPLFTREMKLYSDSKVSDFFSNLTINQSIGFLNEWNASRNHREQIYISYDSTNKVCQAGDIDIAEFGHSKSGDDKPIINYSLAYDHENKEPLFYEEYPGSIVDVSQLQYMLEKAKGYGYKKVGFILDRGYFSKENIHFIDKNGYDFVIMVKGMKKFVHELIRENRGTFEEDRKTSIRKHKTNGITVKRQLFPSDVKERYFHIYYSNRKHASERELLEAKIDRMARALKKLEGQAVRIGTGFEKYFDLIYYHPGKEDEKFVMARERTDVVNEEIKLCGYFCIITSKKMTAKDALELYKSRDASEKLFRGDKSYLGNRSLRVQSDASAEAKIFIEFLALIIRSKMYTCLKNAVTEDEKKQNYMTVPAALKELEKIEMICHLDYIYRLDHAVTATQKTILKAFGIDANYVKLQATMISDLLK